MDMLETAPYALAVDVDAPFPTVVERVRAALAREGFGVLTEIDVQATLAAKLGVEGPPYVILGACNPPLAHRGLQIEPDLGVLLPCNVVVRATGAATRVAAMEPMAALGLSGNPALAPLAYEARERLERALAAV
jgi:uncharacterized protein (DUF302 family)